MTDYSFVSSWRLQAPIDQVWEEIFHTERWPSWWKYRRHRGARERWPLDTYPCRRRDARPLRLGVRTTRCWMNLAAPLARPAFTWNHDALMREAAQGLARRLDAELTGSGSRPRQPARTIAWGGLLVALLALVVVWRRRRA